MPSRFEPCGLPQMIGCLYGSLPIVHDTGGLHDTVTHLDVEQSTGNGFVFETYDPGGLRWAIDQAMAFYRLPPEAREAQVGRVMKESAKQFNHESPPGGTSICTRRCWRGRWWILSGRSEQTNGRSDDMTKLKLIILLVLSVLAIVLVLQNTQAVETKLLFVTVTMPRAALLGLTLLIGFACGILAALGVGKKRKTQTESGT